MEIQVGEYVRTINGEIGKAVSEYGSSIHIVFKNEEWGIRKDKENKDITKHSFNIIDLIEIGDYVNGCKVRKVQKECVELEIVAGVYSDYYVETIYEYEIKSIVTKQAFESIKYEV